MSMELEQLETLEEVLRRSSGGPGHPSGSYSGSKDGKEGRNQGGQN